MTKKPQKPQSRPERQSDSITFNERLTFSWGHIIAAVALIAIAYCTFVGTVYLLKGQFVVAGIITAVITLLIALLFFIPQQLKATDRKFEKCIKWERAFIFASPILFLALMVPFAHAWTVHHRQQQILTSFNQAFESANDMFAHYENYSDIRVQNYRLTLGLDNPGATDTTVRDLNKLATLRLILLSHNYDTLKQAASAWMAKASDKKVTTWNIFLLGDITQIKNAMHNWYNDLVSFSNTRLSDEEDVKDFDSSSKLIEAIDDNIFDLNYFYTDIKGFNPITLFWLILCYAMLLFPYLLQSRHTKTTGTQWTLFGFRTNNVIPEPTPEDAAGLTKFSVNLNNPADEVNDDNSDNKAFSIDIDTASTPKQSEEDNPFESFKL